MANTTMRRTVCMCTWIEVARGDERERIAQAIEAASGQWARDYERISREQNTPPHVGPGSVTAVWGDATRIARTGDTDA